MDGIASWDSTAVEVLVLLGIEDDDDLTFASSG